MMHTIYLFYLLLKYLTVKFIGTYVDHIILGVKFMYLIYVFNVKLKCIL